MLKKTTIGLGITTIVLLLTTLIVLPFAIKSQLYVFADNVKINFDAEEQNLEAEYPYYQLVFKSNTAVNLETSYDDQLHVVYNKYTVGTPKVEIQQGEEKGIVFFDMQYEESMHKIFSLFNPYQEVTIYVPEGVKVGLLGEYYLHYTSSSVKLDEDETVDEYGYDGENYEFYKKAAKFREGEPSETRIKKLAFAGSLIILDYAQGDLDKSTYIDYAMELKSDLLGASEEFFQEMVHFDYEVGRKTAQAGIYYVDQQLQVLYYLEQNGEETTQAQPSSVQLYQMEDGNYAIATVESELGEQAVAGNSRLEELYKNAKDAKEAFRAQLVANGVENSRIDYIIGLFTL